MAQLEYYIMERVLLGNVGGHRIRIFALSGGGGGRLTNLIPTDIVNNPYFEWRETKGKENSPKHVHGGPLPVGWYTVSPTSASKKSETAQMGRCAKLTPRKGTLMMTRQGMFIHQRGKHGSDGCIVPVLDRDAFNDLMDALDKDGGGVLYV